MTIEEKKGLLEEIEQKRVDAMPQEDTEFHRGFRCGLDAAHLLVENVVASTTVPIEPPMVDMKETEPDGYKCSNCGEYVFEESRGFRHCPGCGSLISSWEGEDYVPVDGDEGEEE